MAPNVPPIAAGAIGAIRLHTHTNHSACSHILGSSSGLSDFTEHHGPGQGLLQDTQDPVLAGYLQRAVSLPSVGGTDRVRPRSVARLGR